MPTPVLIFCFCLFCFNPGEGIVEKRETTPISQDQFSSNVFNELLLTLCTLLVYYFFALWSISPPERFFSLIKRKFVCGLNHI